MLTYSLIIDVDETRHPWKLGRLSWPNLAKHEYFGDLTFGTHIKLMASSRNMKVGCNVEYNITNIMRVQMLNIINDRKLI